MSWPNIQAPDYGLEDEVYFPQIKMEFEANYTQSRPKAVRSTGRWSLKWANMPEADYQLLKTFFLANQGYSFSWTHPVTSASYTVRFGMDSLKSTITINDYRQVEVSLEEL